MMKLATNGLHSEIPRLDIILYGDAGNSSKLVPSLSSYKMRFLETTRVHPIFCNKRNAAPSFIDSDSACFMWNLLSPTKEKTTKPFAVNSLAVAAVSGFFVVRFVF